MLRVRCPAALVALALFAGGIGAGLGWRWALVPLVGVAAGAVVVAGSVAPLPAVGLVALLGLAHGRAARAIEERGCGARLPEGLIRLEARLVEPVDGRALAAVRPIAAGCGGTVAARFRAADTLRAGDRLELVARRLPREQDRGRGGGLLVVHQVSLRGSDPDAGDRLRNWLHHASRELYGPRAGLIDALILGRRGGIDPERNAVFGRAGLVHILSISGFHVGLVAGWLLLALRGAGLARGPAGMLAVAGASAYVGFIGAPAPALRAALLAWTVALEERRQRRVQPGALFALTGLLLLVLDPLAIADLGAWLSVSALAGAAAFSRWGERAIERSAVVRILCGSVGATAATAPATALVLGSVSLIGVAVNLIAIPLAALAVPGVLLSLVVRPASLRVAEAVAAGSGVLLDLLEGAAALAARIPGAALTFEPGPWPALAAVGVLGAVVWVIAGRATGREAARRMAWIVGPALALHLAWVVLRPAHAGSVATLHFLNVGQGDAALIRTAGGRWVLVDAGPRSEARDAGRDVVTPFLARLGVRRLDALIVSHAHLDHLGGAAAVLQRVGAVAVLEPGRAPPDAAYRAFLDAVERSGARWVAARSGDRFALDGVTFEVLHPDTSWSGWGADLNEDSVVLRLRAGRFDAVLAGDAGHPVEARLRGRVGAVELIKAGHHGSRGATGAAWLAELRPAVAILSVGANRYGHPTPETLARLEAAAADVWRTDRDGTITVAVDADRMRVRGRARTVQYPLR